MKKLLAVCTCLCLTFTAAGCSPGELAERYLPSKNTDDQDTSVAKTRVYMDETTGILQDFTGNQLTVASDENVYTFDVSQATLECEDGMITGDEVSIIYEGQLNDTDTSTVKALKVVDEYHKKNHLEDRVTHGTLQNLTPNTITLLSDEGNTATFPITGTEQYYQNGLQAGSAVYLHYKGDFPAQNATAPTVLNASHLKVLSISDTEPLSVPSPTPPPMPSEEGASADSQNKEKQLQAVIQDVKINLLQVLVQDSTAPLNIDLTAIPCYFKGGMAPGSSVKISYTGEFNGTTLDGIHILGVTGYDPDTANARHITSTVTGAIIGATANTLTIQTSDGAIVTCSTVNAQNLSTGGLAAGCNVRITFNPSASKFSNIYTCLKIEDA